MKTALSYCLAAGTLAFLVAAQAKADAELAPAAETPRANVEAQAKPEIPKKEIDPKADALLKSAGELIAKAKAFSVKAEIWDDIQLRSGQSIQIGRTAFLQVKRPNFFHIEMQSPRHSDEFFYDGKSVTIYNSAKKFYGSFDAPADMDDALDLASDRFGIELPLTDVIVSDPYQNAIENAASGIYLTTVNVLGSSCEHLAFTNGNVDWQIWIEKGAKPLIKKAVITYRDEAGAPQYTILFSDWNFDVDLPDSQFSFKAPEGAAKIDISEMPKKKYGHRAAGDVKK